MPPTSTHRSSGDLLADRRYEYARAAFDEKDFEAAADLARQVLELAPDFAAAHALLGRALAEQGERDEALGALRQALAREPEDTLGVRLDLARLGALAPDEAMSDAYVRALFDEYAPSFDRHLTRSLGYRGPDLIAAALRRACSRRLRPYRFGPTLDLGCGTGLMGQALAGLCERIEGVDLSPLMLEKARRTKLYDALHEGELVAFLSGRASGEADLVLAADVFVYMASLEAVFREAQRVLRPEGLFAFTVQSHAGEGYVLGADSRYAHAERYLRGLAAAGGFTVVLLESVSTREDRGQPVPGLLAVIER
jgi:predicted TPR repeat methyltransferase